MRYFSDWQPTGTAYSEQVCVVSKEDNWTSDLSNFKQGKWAVPSHASTDILPFSGTSPFGKIIKRERFHFRIYTTYFAQFCLVCYQDDFDGYTQLLRFTDGEHYEEIKEDLANLLKLGIQIESITTDGHKSILKAIKKSIPEAIVQRCLVHIQRMCLLG